MYSFIHKPKHIFLVHGELDGQMVLKEKIENIAGISVTIPNFGESYELEETPQLLERTKRVANYDKVFLKMDVLERIEKLKDHIGEIEEAVKTDIHKEDFDIMNLNHRIQDIQKQIENLIK